MEPNPRRRRRRGPTEAPPTVAATDNSEPGSGLRPVAAPAPARASNVERARARAAAIGGEDLPTPKPAGKKGGMTSEESMARATSRAAEILEHDIGLEDDDKYHVPKESIPDGWSYMWRRVSVYGKEDPQYQVRIAQTGWQPVPAERHPEMMPSTGGPYLTIDRDGMRLMEIPSEVHKLLMQKEQRKAIEQVRVKTEQVGIAPQGQFERNNRGQPMAQVRRGYEPLMVPET